MAKVKGKYTLGGMQFVEEGTVLFQIAQKSNGGQKGEVAAYAADGAIAIRSHIAVLTKAGVNAMTLAAPTATTHDGVIIDIVAATANAHTVTATTIGFNAADASGDVGTFSGAIGDSLRVLAYQGEWIVLNNIGVTIA